MHFRLRAALMLAGFAVALAGCASSGAGSAPTSTSTSPTSSSPASSASSSAGAVTPAALAFAHRVAGAFRQVTSAHFELSTTVNDTSNLGSGDEKISGGKLQAMRISEDLPGMNGGIEMLYVAGKVYIKVPPAFNKTGKPFELVSTSSSDPRIRKLASTINNSIASGSLKTLSDFAAGAMTVKLVGKSPAGTHYSVVVDPTKLPASYPGRAALLAAGITTIPIDVYLDSQGRPVLFTERLSVKGHVVTTKVTVSRYNQPVTISAPPASQLAR
jgi:hypothetical protein